MMSPDRAASIAPAIASWQSTTPVGSALYGLLVMSTMWERATGMPPGMPTSMPGLQGAIRSAGMSAALAESRADAARIVPRLSKRMAIERATTIPNPPGHHPSLSTEMGIRRMGFYPTISVPGTTISVHTAVIVSSGEYGGTPTGSPTWTMITPAPVVSWGINLECFYIDLVSNRSQYPSIPTAAWVWGGAWVAFK
jgi:hypothetical protein